MKKNKWILFAPLLLITVGMAAWLANDIFEENARIQRIKGVDVKVIDQLRKIRIAQESYIAVHKEYAGSWDALLSFVDTADFVITQITERVEVLDNGKDNVIRSVDTMAVVPVFDSLKSKLALKTKEDIALLNRVPVSDTLFTIRADKSGNGQNICEIRDPKPLNPRRQKKGDLKPLQIGSLEVTTLQGNWE